MKLSVRELQESDIGMIANYWLTSDAAFLAGMGVDLAKLPARAEWERMLAAQLNTPLALKQSYCLIWQVDDRPVGHSNANKIIYGQEAYMHLHIWDADSRKQGHGSSLVKRTLPYFFENLKLQTLYCEPYALNPAPNKTLEKAGFTFVRSYTTTPGWINFEQPVNLWELSHEKYRQVCRSVRQG